MQQKFNSYFFIILKCKPNLNLLKLQDFYLGYFLALAKFSLRGYSKTFIKSHLRFSYKIRAHQQQKTYHRRTCVLVLCVTASRDSSTVSTRLKGLLRLFHGPLLRCPMSVEPRWSYFYAFVATKYLLYSFVVTNLLKRIPRVFNMASPD